MATQTAMTMKDALLAEFEHEMKNTRRLLEVVPNKKLDWQPHEKSMTLGRLAGHLAEAVAWTGTMLNEDEFDIAPPGGEGGYTPPEFKSVKEILDTFDANVATARKQIDSKTDAQLMEPWSFKKGGEVLFTLPRLAGIRTHTIKHGVHHRGQLTVYLRQLDVEVPQTYGPTADHPEM